MTHAGRNPVRRGVTLMETVIGSLLVGGVLASTIQLVAPTVRATGLAQDKLTAAALADSLLDEIAALPFEDPTDATSINGPETAETTGTRKEFDDIDDYHDWNAPAQQGDGSAIVGLGVGWTASVSVEHVLANNPGTIVATRTGVKRIVVAVSRDGVLLAERAILRTSAFDDARSGM